VKDLEEGSVLIIPQEAAAHNDDHGRRNREPDESSVVHERTSSIVRTDTAWVGAKDSLGFRDSKTGRGTSPRPVALVRIRQDSLALLLGPPRLSLREACGHIPAYLVEQAADRRGTFYTRQFDQSLQVGLIQSFLIPCF
jgi:hypothetical protein